MRTRSVNHSIGEYVRGDVHTNTIEVTFRSLSAAFNGVTTTFHSSLEAYLANFIIVITSAWRLGVNDAERTRQGVVWHYWDSANVSRHLTEARTPKQKARPIPALAGKASRLGKNSGYRSD